MQLAKKIFGWGQGRRKSDSLASTATASTASGGSTAASEFARASFETQPKSSLQKSGSNLLSLMLGGPNTGLTEKEASDDEASEEESIPVKCHGPLEVKHNNQRHRGYCAYYGDMIHMFSSEADFRTRSNARQSIPCDGNIKVEDVPGGLRILRNPGVLVVELFAEKTVLQQWKLGLRGGQDIVAVEGPAHEWTHAGLEESDDEEGEGVVINDMSPAHPGQRGSLTVHFDFDEAPPDDDQDIDDMVEAAAAAEVMEAAADDLKERSPIDETPVKTGHGGGAQGSGAGESELEDTNAQVVFVLMEGLLTRIGKRSKKPRYGLLTADSLLLWKPARDQDTEEPDAVLRLLDVEAVHVGSQSLTFRVADGDGASHELILEPEPQSELDGWRSELEGLLGTRRVRAQGAETPDEEVDVLCDGYMVKFKDKKPQSVRHVVLTDHALMFWNAVDDREKVDPRANIITSDIVAVIISGRQFDIDISGVDGKTHSICLRVQTSEATEMWTEAFKALLGTIRVFSMSGDLLPRDGGLATTITVVASPEKEKQAPAVEAPHGEETLGQGGFVSLFCKVSGMEHCSSLTAVHRYQVRACMAGSPEFVQSDACWPSEDQKKVRLDDFQLRRPLTVALDREPAVEQTLMVECLRLVDYPGIAEGEEELLGRCQLSVANPEISGLRRLWLSDEAGNSTPIAFDFALRLSKDLPGSTKLSAADLGAWVRALECEVADVDLATMTQDAGLAALFLSPAAAGTTSAPQRLGSEPSGRMLQRGEAPALDQPAPSDAQELDSTRQWLNEVFNEVLEEQAAREIDDDDGDNAASAALPRNPPPASHASGSGPGLEEDSESLPHVQAASVDAATPPVGVAQKLQWSIGETTSLPEGQHLEVYENILPGRDALGTPRVGGMTFTLSDRRAFIQAVEENSVADQQGVQQGDELLMVNDVPVAYLASPEDLSATLACPEVKLTMSRGDSAFAAGFEDHLGSLLEERMDQTPRVGDGAQGLARLKAEQRARSREARLRSQRGWRPLSAEVSQRLHQDAEDRRERLAELQQEETRRLDLQTQVKATSLPAFVRHVGSSGSVETARRRAAPVHQRLHALHAEQAERLTYQRTLKEAAEICAMDGVSLSAYARGVRAGCHELLYDDGRERAERKMMKMEDERSRYLEDRTRLVQKQTDSFSRRQQQRTVKRLYNDHQVRKCEQELAVIRKELEELTDAPVPKTLAKSRRWRDVRPKVHAAEATMDGTKSPSAAQPEPEPLPRSMPLAFGSSSLRLTEEQQCSEPWLARVDHVLATLNAAVAARCGREPSEAPQEVLQGLVDPLSHALSHFRRAAAESEHEKQGSAMKLRESRRLYDGTLMTESKGRSLGLRPDVIKQPLSGLEDLLESASLAQSRLLAQTGPKLHFTEETPRRIHSQWPPGSRFERPKIAGALFGFNPGLKSRIACETKASARFVAKDPGYFKFEHLLDIARCALIFPTCEALCQGLGQIMREFEVIQIVNHYHSSKQNLLGERYVAVSVVTQPLGAAEAHVCEVRLQEICFFRAQFAAEPTLRAIGRVLRETYQTPHIDGAAIEYVARRALRQPRDNHDVNMFRRQLAHSFGSSIAAWRRCFRGQAVVRWRDWEEACRRLKVARERAGVLFDALDAARAGKLGLFDFDADSVIVLLKFLARLLCAYAQERGEDRMAAMRAPAETLMGWLWSKCPKWRRPEGRVRLSRIEFEGFHCALVNLGLVRSEAERVFTALRTGGSASSQKFDREFFDAVSVEDLEWLRTLPSILHVDCVMLAREPKDGEAHDCVFLSQWLPTDGAAKPADIDQPVALRHKTGKVGSNALMLNPVYFSWSYHRDPDSPTNWLSPKQAAGWRSHPSEESALPKTVSLPPPPKPFDEGWAAHAVPAELSPQWCARWQASSQDESSLLELASPKAGAASQAAPPKPLDEGCVALTAHAERLPPPPPARAAAPVVTPRGVAREAPGESTATSGTPPQGKPLIVSGMSAKAKAKAKPGAARGRAAPPKAKRRGDDAAGQ